MKLPSTDELRESAHAFLVEGKEVEEAALMAQCEIEVGELQRVWGTVKEVDFSLRCGRDVFEKLRPEKATFGSEQENKLMGRLREAVEASLPSGYKVGNFKTRVGKVKPMAAGAGPGVGSEAGLEDTPAMREAAFVQFTDEGFLKGMGREAVKQFIGGVTAELGGLGVTAPAEGVADEEYARAVSQMLRSLEPKEGGLREKIGGWVVAAARMSVEADKEVERRYLSVPLVRRRTGRALLGAMAGGHGMVQDYPENLTEQQSELVGWLMSYLRDYADCADDLDPDVLLKYEREVSHKLGALDGLGLAVFAGGYKAKQVFENGQSYWMPITVVLVAAKTDVRIKRGGDGSEFIKGAIPRKAAGAGVEGADSRQAGADDGNGGGKAGELQFVSASVEALGAELREFRKAMAAGVRTAAEAFGVPANVAAARTGGGAVWTVLINGKEERLYHVSALLWALVMESRTIELHFVGPAHADREEIYQFFESGLASVTGLRENPDIRERGIGPELASMLKATLESCTGEQREVFCRVRDHTTEERGIVFQAKLSESAGAGKRGGVDAAAEATSPAAPVCRFRPAGRVCEVVFEGSAVFHVGNTDGAKYLDYLLHHPNKAIRALDLEREVKPDKQQVRQGNSIQKVVDKQTKQEARGEMVALEAELEEAQAEGQRGKVERLTQEIARLKDVVDDDGLLGGDTGERARNNVRKAIGNVLKALRKGSKDERAFATHIARFVSLGYEVSYSQPEDRTWG